MPRRRRRHCCSVHRCTAPWAFTVALAVLWCSASRLVTAHAELDCIILGGTDCKLCCCCCCCCPRARSLAMVNMSRHLPELVAVLPPDGATPESGWSPLCSTTGAGRGGRSHRAASAACAAAAPDSAARAALQALQARLEGVYLPSHDMRMLYRSFLGVVVDGGDSPLPPRRAQASSTDAAVYVIVGVTGALLLLAVLMGWLHHGARACSTGRRGGRRRAGRLSWRNEAPGVGPVTTLLITDIQVWVRCGCIGREKPADSWW